MSETYFVVTCSEDGINIRDMSRDGLQATLRDYIENEEDPFFLNAVPEIDKGCWGHEHGVLIIKGEIVVPKERQRVKEYEI